MAAAPGLDAAIDAARAIGVRFATCTDEQLLVDGAAVEHLGRLVDALRVGFAAEAERRSAPIKGERRLSFRQGARDGVELVRLVTRTGHREAKRRVALGSAIAPEISITGDVLQGREPVVAAAVEEGRIGLEAARLIVEATRELRRRAEPDALATMTASLIQVAETADVEVVREAAVDWALVVDPDGAEPRERKQRRKRALSLGQTLSDGTTRLTMILTPEDLAFMKELLASRRRGIVLCRTEPGGDDDPELDGPEWRPEGDARSVAQQDYDTAVDALRAGAAATEPAPPLHEIVVTITASEVEARRGQAWTAGVLAGVPLPVVERGACTGSVRLLITSDAGEPLRLSRRHRLFSPAQRKALTVAAGGTCQFPGCRVPHPCLEAHHADWWDRDAGPTDVENGVMLCAFHHHLVHAGDSPVRIVRHRGSLFIVPASWWGPPRPEHRLRAGPPHRRAA